MSPLRSVPPATCDGAVLFAALLAAGLAGFAEDYFDELDLQATASAPTSPTPVIAAPRKTARRG